jgi:hypothetical protein
LIHVKVGNEERPAKQSEIDAVSADFEEIYADTEYVTDHRTELTMVGAQGVALDLNPPLTYIEHQLVAGLQVPLSLLGRGEGTNRATAEVQLANFDRRVKVLQRIIKRTVELEVFKRALNKGDDEEVPKLVWGEAEEREEAANMDMIIKLKQGGIITAQKANDLLPEEFREKLPEMDPMMNMPMQKGVPKGDMVKPDPKKERIQSTREKRPKKGVPTNDN